jgi:hypothetical protein
VNGLIDDCGKIVAEGKAKVGWFDVSTLKEPYRIEGKKTMGLELAEQQLDPDRGQDRVTLAETLGSMGAWFSIDPQKQDCVGLEINGKPVPAKADPGTFATLRRQWKRNDTVQLTLPFTYRTVPIDNRTPDLVALMHGPLLMTAVDPPEELALPTALPGALTLRPFYKVQRETYSTYFRR